MRAWKRSVQRGGPKVRHLMFINSSDSLHVIRLFYNPPVTDRQILKSLLKVNMLNNLWTYRGRLNRQSYFLRILIAAAVIIVVKAEVIPFKSQFPPAAGFVFLAVATAVLIFGIFQHILDIHDGS